MRGRGIGRRGITLKVRPGRASPSTFLWISLTMSRNLNTIDFHYLFGLTANTSVPRASHVQTTKRWHERRNVHCIENRDRKRKASKKQRDGGICTYASRSPRQQALEQPRLGKGEEPKESKGVGMGQRSPFVQ